MSDDYAATQIQRFVRGWLVRRRPEVQELITFWKAIGEEPRIRKQMPTSEFRPLIEHFKEFSKQKKSKSIEKLDKFVKHIAFDDVDDDEEKKYQGKKVYDDRIFKDDIKSLKKKLESESSELSPLSDMNSEELCDLIDEVCLTEQDWKWDLKKWEQKLLKKKIKKEEDEEAAKAIKSIPEKKEKIINEIIIDSKKYLQYNGLLFDHVKLKESIRQEVKEEGVMPPYAYGDFLQTPSCSLHSASEIINKKVSEYISFSSSTEDTENDE